jgi:UDP-N-acetylmuramoylalanine--D-glutamate ligase
VFPAHTFKNRKVGLFGLARSGLACAEALRLGGAEVFAWDDSEAAVTAAKEAQLPVADLHDIEFTALDSLILSPGVPLTHPEPHWTVEKAKAAGVEIIGDTEVFQREVAGTGARIVAITGTNGKSTTTALIGHIFQALGRDVDVGGNIGTAVFLMRQPVEGRIYVLELSSFQIDLMPGLKPDVGILTNLTPDHLDRHGNMENYAGIKARMFLKQDENDTAVIGVDDEWCAEIAACIKNGSKVRAVSVVHEIEEGISAVGGILREWQNGTEVARIDLRSMPALKGAHNWQNACMAYGAARAFGMGVAEIRNAMERFPGLAHRMQEIGCLGYVPFINDSKATNADAAAKALASFENIFWIAGGIAKTGGIEPLSPFFSRIEKAYLIGEAADEFAKTLNGKVPFELCGTLDKAVVAAARDAVNSGLANAVVLLSPACASFDHYRNFEIRGDAFVKLVSELPGIVMTIKGEF